MCVYTGWAVMGHTFNPRTRMTGRWTSEFSASLVYRVSYTCLTNSLVQLLSFAFRILLIFCHICQYILSYCQQKLLKYLFISYLFTSACKSTLYIIAKYSATEPHPKPGKNVFWSSVSLYNSSGCPRTDRDPTVSQVLRLKGCTITPGNFFSLFFEKIFLINAYTAC